MEFTKKTVLENGKLKEKFFIDNKEVSEKAYFNLLEDSVEKNVDIKPVVKQEDNCDDGEMCILCEATHEILAELDALEDYDDKFKFLREELDCWYEMAFNDGRIGAFLNGAEILTQVAEAIQNKMMEE